MDQNNVIPITFLGLADRLIERNENSFPLGISDLMGVSLIKNSHLYPIPLNNLSFLFLIHKSIIDEFNNNKAYISLDQPNGDELFRANFNTDTPLGFDLGEVGYFKYPDWIPVNISGINVFLSAPGIYSVNAHISEKKLSISNILFNYIKIPEYTADELYGIKSKLLSCREAELLISCEECKDSIKIYTGIKKSINRESEGAIWYSEIPDDFVCRCSKSSFNLRFYKENFHSILTADPLKNYKSKGQPSYERLYSHNIIHGIIKEFLELIKSKKSENVIQKFIEENPVLLSPFNAKKLFLKPSILGKYVADFAILDANKNLIFIEIEKPTLSLFKKNGHPTADLNHAYDQVNDWLLEYKTSSTQILNRMGLSENDVRLVKGFVIAGVLEERDKEFYTRHIKQREAHHTGFLTFDELASSVLNLSRELA